MTVRDIIDRYYDCVNRGDNRLRQRAQGAGRGHLRRRLDANVQVAELDRQLGFELADMDALATAPLVGSAATIWSTLAYRQGLGRIRSGHGGFRNRLQGGRINNSRSPSRVAFPSIRWRTARPSFVGASYRGRKTTCE